MDGNVTSESNRVKEAENDKQLRKSREPRITRSEVPRQT